MWNLLGTIVGITIVFVSASLDAGTARADAKRYTIMMDAFGKSNEVSPQKLEDLEQFLVGTGTPGVDALDNGKYCPVCRRPRGDGDLPLQKPVRNAMLAANCRGSGECGLNSNKRIRNGSEDHQGEEIYVA